MDKKQANQEIKRLKALLEARKEDYAIFGRTSEDADGDIEIIKKIKDLEKNQTNK